jgi:hypothetical protein
MKYRQSFSFDLEVVLINTVCLDENSIKICCCRLRHLRALASDAAGKLNVLGHDCYTLGVDGSKVSILEKTNKVSLS